MFFRHVLTTIRRRNKVFFFFFLFSYWTCFASTKGKNENRKKKKTFSIRILYDCFLVLSFGFSPSFFFFSFYIEVHTWGWLTRFFVYLCLCVRSYVSFDALNFKFTLRKALKTREKVSSKGFRKAFSETSTKLLISSFLKETVSNSLSRLSFIFLRLFARNLFHRFLTGITLIPGIYLHKHNC